MPPDVLTRVEALPPTDGTRPTQDHVLLEFTIGVDGRAIDVAVIESAGTSWDDAARNALLQWTFRPARHEGANVPSRTRLSFAMPHDSHERHQLDAGTGDAPTLALDGGEPLDTPEHHDIYDADGGIIGDELPAHEMSTTIVGRTVPKSRGSGDFQIEVGALKAVPRATGGEYLKLAPGILLTNEGGDGHPERIFLRGFDAREGQDLELSVDGVPVNDSGNLHGNGYADLNFLIPELVQNLRVIEGPFDPRQGNYAVAGSADYELGLTQRGLTAKASVGSYNTQRITLLWGPLRQSTKTFGGVQLSRSDGFGQNRAAQSARALAQYELTLSESTTVRIQTSGYGAQFKMAGVIRNDDFSAGRIGFFDTYDSRQGGDSLRFSLSADLHSHSEGVTHDHQVFVALRQSRLLENFTGFLHDPQEPQQSIHVQRGDLLDRDVKGLMFGARGYGRVRAKLFGRPQELELGYFARADLTHGQQQRILAGDSNTPYRKDLDLDSTLTDIGLYADANFSPWWFLTLRGGVRADLLTYTIQNNCAVQEVRRPSTTNPPGDASCLSQRDFGQYREPTERVSATGAVVMPRVSLLLGPWKRVSLTGSYGRGVRSIDPQFVNQNRDTPFASIQAGEGGAIYADRVFNESLDLSARAVFFATKVDKDLIFSEQAGRNIIGGSTTRLGALAQARARGSFFDVAAHVTWVQSKFDDTNLLVPYVPDVVVRGDAAVFHELPWKLLNSAFTGTIGLGMTFVGRRALPFGQRSDVIFVTDVNAELSWRFVTIGVSITNLFDRRYRLAEFNYAADFQTTGSSPTLVPSRLFTAGAPRQIFFTAAFTIGGQS